MTARVDQVKTLNWRTAAEFVGISAVVGSLIFVGFQIQLDRQVAISQVNMAAMEARLTIETTMAENVDVWIKAANLEELSESEWQVVEHLTRMSSSKAYFESMADNRVIGQMTFPENSPIIGAFSTFLFENPGARRIWLEYADRQEAYTEILQINSGQHQFFIVVRRQLAMLDDAHDAGAFE